MITKGRAQKVTVHLNEDTSSSSGFIYQQVFRLLFDSGIAGATMTRPEESFGSHHLLHDRVGQGAAGRHLPVRIEFIDSADKVEALLPSLCALVTDGLVEVQETIIVKSVRQEAAR